MDMDTNDTSATSTSISASANTSTSSNDNKHDDTSSNSKSRPNAEKLNFVSRKNTSKSKSVASITTSTTLTPLRFTYGLRHPHPHRNCHHRYNTQQQQKQCQVKAKLRRSARLKNSTGGTSTASAAATVVSASTTNNNNVGANSNSKSENSWFVSPPPTASITKIADSASAGNSNSMASSNGKVNVNENDPYYSVSNISTLTQSTTSASVNASGSVSGLSCSCYIADTVDTKNSNAYYYDQDHTGQENDHKHEEDDVPTDCEHLDEIEVVKKIGLGEGSKEMQLNTKIDKLGVPNDYYLRHQTRHSHQNKHENKHQCQKQLLNHNTNEKGPNNKLKTLSTARTRSSTNTRKRSWALSSSSSSKLSTLSTRLSSRIVLSKNKTKTKDKIKKWTHYNCKKYKSSSGLFITPPHLLSSQKQSFKSSSLILTTSTSPLSSFNYSNKNLLVGISTVDNGAGNENDDNTKNTIIAKNTKKKLTSTNEKQKHRYHLRSFHQNECHENENDHEKRHQTYSDGDSHDDNTEEEKEEEMQPQVNVIDTYIDTEDKNRFIELETLSNLIVATTSQPNQHMHQHHRPCSNPIIQCVFQQPLPACRYSYDSIVTSHNFMSNYGSLYYQSLLDREEKQSMDSKKRLEDYYKQSTSTDVATVTSSNISSSGLNVEEGGKGQKQLRPPTQMRMRTRSFCKSEENDFKKITSLSSASLPKSSSSNANKNTLIKTRSNDKEDKITEQNEKEKSRHKSIKYIQVKKQKEITADMRFKLVDWIIEVMNEFKLVHETLHCCVYLIDRSLEEIAIPTKKFHPLGCACLLMASKLVEVKHPRAADIAFFTNNICTVTDICKMELEIAQALSFHLQFVTAFHFIGRFLNASHVVIRTSPSSSSLKGTSISSSTMKTVDMKLQHYPFCCDDDDDDDQGGKMNLLESSTEEDYGISEKDSNDVSHIKRYSYIMNNKLDAMALYFLDMSLLIPEFVDMKGSLVAAASVYIARAMVGIKDSEGNCWSEAMKYYTGYDVKYLAKAVSILYRYHNRNIKEESDGTNPKRRAIVKKYMHKDFLEVAKTPSILYEDLHLNSYL